MEIKDLGAGIKSVTPAGRLTVGRELQRLEWQVEELVKEGTTKLIMDLSQVDYIDSAALGVLVACTSKAREGGGRMRICGVTDRVKKIFDLTGVTRVLELSSTLEDAKAAVQ